MTPVRIFAALAAATLAATSLRAQAPATAPTIKVGARVQTQFRLAGGDSSGSYNPARPGSGFEVRRLRIQVDGRLNERVSFVIAPSFEMGALRMRDAYVKTRVLPRLSLSIGQEKSPFQRYELTSSNTLPSIERGLRNFRLTGREGLNDLLLQNGYASHDLGAFAEATPTDRVTLRAGVQNGSRESSADVNNAKSAFARANAVVLRDGEGHARLQLGASFASRDRAVCSTCAGTIAFYADSSKRTNAWGLDAEWGGFRPGLHVIADLAGGDNVRLANRVSVGRNTGNVRTTADTAIATFRGLSVVSSYRVRMGGETSTVVMLEPALRIDWLDPDTRASGDDGLLLTPVLAVFFANTEVLKIGVDVYRYRDAGVRRTATELKVAWEAYF